MSEIDYHRQHGELINDIASRREQCHYCPSLAQRYAHVALGEYRATERVCTRHYKMLRDHGCIAPDGGVR